jgi:GNAT superfamily N-acetyltransferase
MELRDIQSCLRATIESRASLVGPFLVLHNESSDNPFLNYAVPVVDAAPTPDDVTALVAYFTERDRLPRLEYVRPAPAVDSPLAAAGFDVTETLTLMALDEFVPVSSGSEYRALLPTDEATLRVANGVQHVAYGEPDAEPDPTGLLRLIANGGCVAIAEAPDGTLVGAGVFAQPSGGLVEIAGVGVLPKYRRHGVGRLLASALTQEALRRGHQPFLQVEKDEPERIYQRLGYRVIGDMADARRS